MSTHSEEYIYKGFKVIYKIQNHKQVNDLYQANGYAQCLLNKGDIITRKFHTESDTLGEVQVEIKKMLEDYIDFEWNEFHKMHS